MSYEPKPDSIPHVAIAYIAKNGPTTTDKLAEITGAVPKNIRPCLGVAIKHGAVHFVKNGGEGKGDNYAQLAHEYRLTEMQVRTIIKRGIARARARTQTNLF